MGLDDQRFSGESLHVKEDFLCSICHGVVEDPIACLREHVFCKICIKQWLQTKSSCPIDRKYLNKSQLCPPSRFFRNFYSKLVMKCIFESNGCEERRTIEALDSHQNECKFNPVVESKCEKGCDVFLMGNELKSHNCVAYLKSINLKNSELTILNDQLVRELLDKYEKINSLKHTNKSQLKDIENAKKRELELEKKQLDLELSLNYLQNEMSIKYNEINGLKHIISKQREDIGKANNITVRNFESMMSSQSNAVQECNKKIGQISTSYHRNPTVDIEDDVDFSDIMKIFEEIRNDLSNL